MDGWMDAGMEKTLSVCSSCHFDYHTAAKK